MMRFLLIVCLLVGAAAPTFARGRIAFTPGPPSSSPGAVAQIHNAPGWLPAHAYTPATGPFTRVNAGAGWNPASGTWNPGQVLNAYQLTSGSCKSGAVMPSGTGAAIVDGSCTWKFLSTTDYITLTGWSNDNRPWASGRVYNYFDIVTSDQPLRAYVQISVSCTSTIAPVGVGTAYSMVGDGNSLGQSADGCQWVHIADVLYSSRRTFIPTQTHQTTPAVVEVVHKNGDYTGLLWNDRQYVAGQGGEQTPLSIRNHDQFFGEGITLVCQTGITCGRIILTTAPGESYADSMGPTDPVTGYDPSKGVALLINDQARWPVESDGLLVENSVDVIGLQIKALHGAAVVDMTATYDNNVTVRYCVCEGGVVEPYATPSVISLDTSGMVANSLLIAHGPIGIAFKYAGVSFHNTIVHADGTGVAAIESGWNWVFNDPVVSGTAMFGFAHAGAILDSTSKTVFGPSSGHNVSDAPVGDSGMAEWYGSGHYDAYVSTIPGTAYGVTKAAAFMGVGDYRVKPGGPLAGTGAAFGTFVTFCQSPACGPNVNYTVDTPDLIGTPRPGSDGWDIGAWQTPQ